MKQMIATCINISIDIEEVIDETRDFPIKDKDGNPTGKTATHRIVTATGNCKTTDGKRDRSISVNWFDPSVGTDLPVEGKPFVVSHFRKIEEEKNHSYTITM